MTFKAAGRAVTVAVTWKPLSYLPRSYSRICYWLNAADENGTDAFADARLAAFERPFFSDKEYRDLIQRAIDFGIITEKLPPHPFLGSWALHHRQSRERGFTKEQAVDQSREAERDAVNWCKDLRKIVEGLRPQMEHTPSEFATNLDLLSKIYEFSPLERELLAFLSDDRMQDFIAKRAEEEGDQQGSYAELTSNCIRVDGGGVEHSGEDVMQALFRSSTLLDGHLLVPIADSFQVELETDEQILDLLHTPGLTEAHILSQIIGTLAQSTLDFAHDFDYLDFSDEMLNAMLGGMKRKTTQGKVYFLNGDPGAGKSVLPATIARYIEGIKRAKDPEFKLPVFVIGIDEGNEINRSVGAPRRRQRNAWSTTRSDDEGGKNNARDRDVRKLLRARQMLQRMGIPAILQVEEADGLLSTLVSDDGSAMTRALRSQVLDHSPVITVLISNHPEKFDESANRRVIGYKMSVPPADKRREMVLTMSRKFGLLVRPKDAAMLSKTYLFTPGKIESALQYLADMVSGEKERGLRRGNAVSFDQLLTAFRRKAVTLAGTSLTLAALLEAPKTIDLDLYVTHDFGQAELSSLAEGSGIARLWLLTGLPATEVTELALYAASRRSECEVGQIGTYGSNVYEQLETAKRNKSAIVITGFELVLDELKADQLITHPLIIAAEEHVANGHSVYFVAHKNATDIDEPVRKLFSSARRNYAGFHLGAGPDLVRMIIKIAKTKELNPTTSFFMENGARHTKRGSKRSAPALPEMVPDAGSSGILIAGPGDVRSALLAMKDDGRPFSIHLTCETMERQGACSTLDRQKIRSLTGLLPRPVPSSKLH